MTTLTTVELNALATKWGTDNAYGALFTADPGLTGTVVGEVSGGSPAYARLALSWNTASGGVTQATVTFDVPAGTTVTYMGTCAAGTAGVSDLKSRGPMSYPTFGSQAKLTVTFTYTQAG